jgi:hypothetical protein
MDNAPDIRAAIDRALEEDDEAWNDSALHVSDLSVALPDGGGCPIALRKRMRGDPKEQPHLGIRVMFSHGQAIHDRFAELLKKGLDEVGSEWHVVAVEYPIPDHKLGTAEEGRADLVLERLELPEAVADASEGVPDVPFPEVTGTLVVDWKTVRGRAMRYIRSGGPKPAHTLQVQTYARALDADGGLLVYVDREGQNGIEVFPVERDDERVTQMEKAVERLRAMPEDPEPLDVGMGPQVSVRSNKGPDSVTLKRPWQASYCDFEDCPCAQTLPFEKEIVGYINAGRLEMKDEYANLRGLTERLLTENGEL